MELRGRKTIYTCVSEITKDNVVDVVMDCMWLHNKNRNAIYFLDYYEKGKQPILRRVKKVRPEVNNMVVENHAHEIVEFKVGYVFGSPITYVQRASEPDENKDSTIISKLNEMLFEEGKSFKDQELATTFNKVGVAYRCVLPIKSEEKTGTSLFKLINMNPSTTFVIRSNDIYKKVIAGVSYSVDKDLVKTFSVYTDNSCFTFRENNLGKVQEEANGIGVIPIVEYINDYDRMGSFERVVPLLDAMNNATSDRVNGLEQFIQHLIWFNNVDIDTEKNKQLRDSGAIVTKSSGDTQADIKFLAQQLNQVEVQALSDYMYDQILQISGIPGREQSTGGNTGQALMLGGSGWQLAETAAKKQELLFMQSEREMLNVIKNIVEKSNDENLNTVNINDIDIKFTRNKVSNLLTKTQGLANMLTAGINPRIAIANCDLFGDPEQVYKDSEEYLSKWKQPEKAKIADAREG